MKKKIIKIIIYVTLSILAVGIVIFIGMYLGNKEFRQWSDINILRKDIADSKLPQIELQNNQDADVYTYGEYVVILEDNKLHTYDKSGKEISENNITISDPIFKSKERYLAIGDKGRSKLYLIYDNALQWEKDVEGDISQVDVNKDGIVGVILTGTAYKSVITLYNNRGDEYFKSFLSTSSATDLAISDDGENVAFTEINTDSSRVTSKVKVISVEKAKNSPTEAITDTYNLESGVLLIKIKYNKNKVVCLSDKGVYSFENGQISNILETSNNSFIDIELDGNIVSIQEAENGKFEINITNTSNSNVNTYEMSDNVKRIYCSENIIALDTGNKVEFVNNLGWLIKKIRITQNIKDIIVGDKLVAIVYKDKIEIMSI